MTSKPSDHRPSENVYLIPFFQGLVYLREAGCNEGGAGCKYDSSCSPETWQVIPPRSYNCFHPPSSDTCLSPPSSNICFHLPLRVARGLVVPGKSTMAAGQSSFRTTSTTVRSLTQWQAASTHCYKIQTWWRQLGSILHLPLGTKKFSSNCSENIKIKVKYGR